MKGYGAAMGKGSKDRISPYGEKGASAEEFPVYVGNLAWNVKWQDLKDHMRQAGEVKNARVLTMDGTERGKSKGAGIVQYGSKWDADNAIATLNGSELMGREIVVDEWTGGSGGPKKGGDFSGKGQKAAPITNGGKAGGGKAWNNQEMKPGDWVCPNCGDHQFAKNTSCRSCGWHPGAWPMGGAGGKAAGKGKGLSDVRGENLIYVGNLPFKATWKELKDHMGQAGKVEFVKVLTEDGTDFGRSKGTGCVRFSDEVDLDTAVSMLNGSELMDRAIVVDRWTKKERS